MLLVALSACVFAAEPGPWDEVKTGNVTVRSRSRPGSAVREIQAETDLDAPVAAVQQTLMSPDRFRDFMPYVAESRFIEGTTAKDEKYTVYTRLQLPVITSRDYVVQSHTLHRSGQDGNDEFRTEWKSLPDELPKRANSIRMRVNEGSWQVTPLEGGRCHIIYRSLIDPAGMVPPFLADFANRTALPDMFKAIEKEAKRLASDGGAR